MLAPVRRIPAIAVAGFRHAGRASVLGALIRQKPKPDRWAVIGAGCGSSQANVEVEEVAPGCPCCSAMLPFRVGLTRLLRRTAAAPPALLLIKGGLKAMWKRSAQFSRRRRLRHTSRWNVCLR